MTESQILAIIFAGAIVACLVATAVVGIPVLVAHLLGIPSHYEGDER